jgi:hypothetical protein
MSDDRALRDRLASLASAVPVRPSSPAAMVRRPVRLGPAFRPASGRSWVLVAVVAVLLVAAVGILGSGGQPAYGPVVESVRQGDFELTLRTEMGRYAPGEPIDIEASLTYLGSDDGVQIGHASGARQSPLGFGIHEPVVGDLRLGPGWDEMCVLTQLTANTPLEQAFQKSAGWSGSNPRAAEYQAWVEDPELRLDRGTWHVFAVAEFTIGDCGPAEYKLQAEIAVTVESTGPTEPALPSPTELANSPQSNTVRDGDFELTIRSGKTRYTTDEAVDVTASLVYRGPQPTVDIWPGRIAIGSRERRGDLVVGVTTLDIGYRLTLERDVPFDFSIRTERWAGGRIWIESVPRLPVGTWHVYALANARLELAPEAEQFALEAELTIEVEAAAPAPTEIANPTQSATDRDGDFELTFRSDKTHYAPNEPIDVTAALTYHGRSQAVEITHDSGGPILFGIREKVFGAIQVGGLSLLTCGGTTLRRDDPIVKGFQKGGAFSNEHPEAEMHRAWMMDPELRLPEGTWHLYAASGGPCMGSGPTFGLMAEIEIVVDDNPTATPGHPAPTEWADKPVYGGADIGWVVLQLKSTHARYEAGEPVELEASYWFADGKPLVASHFQPELALAIEQLDATDPQTRAVIDDNACVDLGMVEGVERLLVLGPGNVTSMRADLVPPNFEDLFVDGTLRLPVGRWRISASVAGTFAPCGERGDPYVLAAAVEIEVVEHVP